MEKKYLLNKLAMKKIEGIYILTVLGVTSYISNALHNIIIF